MASSRFIRDCVSTYSIIKNQRDFTQWVQRHIGHGGGYYAALNPEKILHASNHPHVHKILAQADGLIVDGIGAKWALQNVLGLNCDRITGVDAMEQVLRHANANKLSVGIMGGTQDVIEKVQSHCIDSYPQCSFAFFFSGYHEGPGNALASLRKTHVDMVFVGLGSPKQEAWIAEHREAFPNTFFTGVGGSLDVMSGTVQRAPAWIQAIGLEWLYRFIRQPVKRAKRIVRLFQFVVMVWKEKA